MSRARLENLDRDRQLRLFESAAEEFGSHGYDAASLNRILDQSGMSKSSLYYYFDDKADLFTTMMERAIGFLMRELGGFDPLSLTADTYWSELESVYRRSIEVVNRNAWYVKLGRMFYRLRGDRRASAQIGHVYQAAQSWMERTIVHGQKLGVVRTDLPNSMLIDAAMGLGEALDHWMVEHWDEMSAAERFDMVGVQIALLHRLLAA